MKKIRITPFVIAAGIVLGTAARVFAVSRTDMKTGLLLPDTAFVCNWLYYGIILLAAVGAVISSHIDTKRGACGTVEIKPSAGVCIAVGFGLIAAALCACYDGIDEMDAFTPTGFIILVDFIAAAALCIIALCTLYSKRFSPGLGFVYILGGGYYVCRGIYCFMIRMAIVTIPEYLIDCLTTICGAVFFVMFARLFSGNGGKLTAKAFFAWGTMTCVISFSSFLGAAVSKLLPEVSKRIVFSANQAEFYFQSLRGIDAYHMAFPPLPNLAVGVFAAVSMIAVCFSNNAEE
ncbi:MAG: hypothetical protein K2N56_00175 [Oscillospiraceae bacterium]|nr:hypothetical protein [Oscillospiraceae bacterium]